MIKTFANNFKREVLKQSEIEDSDRKERPPISKPNATNTTNSTKTSSGSRMNKAA
jgi:hypothetical protein